MSRTRIRRTVLILIGAALVTGALLLPAVAAGEPKPAPPPALEGIPTLPGPLAAPAPAAASLKLLKASRDSGPAGTRFTLTGTGLPANKQVTLVWGTAKVSYLLNTLPENIEYWGRKIDQIETVLGTATTDADGAFSADLTAPRDFGAVHDIYAEIDGVKVAKSGFQIVRLVTVSPKRGPVGTPITIKVSGLGWHPYLSTLAVTYDNRSAGFISATNTRGSATVTIRAAGPVGWHSLQVLPASAAVPYLDIEQSAVAFIGRYETTFTVTKDSGPPPLQIVWPEKSRPTLAARTTMSTETTAAGVSVDATPDNAPILTDVNISARGLTPNAEVRLQWASVFGTRATASGWALITNPLGTAKSDADGKLKATIKVPDGLGGWHGVQLLQGGQLKAQVPVFVEHSVVSFGPTKLKAGEKFTVHLKGIGWTELDNTIAVTYDNGYVGYACGFYSQGDIQLTLVATGSPGTHLIDLYPTIYRGKDTDTWLEHQPFLSYKLDFPGLALGYRLPAIHLAIQITK